MTSEQFMTLFVVGWIVTAPIYWVLIKKAKRTKNVVLGVVVGLVLLYALLLSFGVFKACIDFSNGISLLELSFRLDNSMNPISERGYKMYMRNNEIVQRAISSFSSHF